MDFATGAVKSQSEAIDFATLRGLAISYSMYQITWGVLYVVVPVFVANHYDSSIGSSVTGFLWAAMGIAGAGNSGTALAALFAPGLAAAFGWVNVFGIVLIPLVIVLVAFCFMAKDAPDAPPPKTWAEYLDWSKKLTGPDQWATAVLGGSGTAPEAWSNRSTTRRWPYC